MRRDLLALEPFVDRPHIDRVLLEELFRSFHTLKGLAGMVGVQEVEQLAHQMEGYLRALRHGQTILTSQALDGLIDGAQMLEQTIAAYQTLQPVPDVGPVMAKLSAIVPEASALPPSPERSDGRVSRRATRPTGSAGAASGWMS